MTFLFLSYKPVQDEQTNGRWRDKQTDDGNV